MVCVCVVCVWFVYLCGLCEVCVCVVCVCFVLTFDLNGRHSKKSNSIQLDLEWFQYIKTSFLQYRFCTNMYNVTVL